MNYKVSDITSIIHATPLQKGEDGIIENILTDSRKLLFPQTSVFFALPGHGRNGAAFIRSLYEKGVRNFVTDETDHHFDELTDANILSVNDVQAALQELAAFHRRQFTYPVIGITGSNGKTIVKEWLHQLIADDRNMVRSPKSFNSQVGVPLSVWRMNESNDLGVFEAGISQPGEMEKLEKIIRPGIGILTFIGSAHSEGFENTDQKIKEKLQLFRNSNQLIYCSDTEKINTAVAGFIALENPSLQTFTWSKKSDANVFVREIKKTNGYSQLTCLYNNKEFSFSIAFTDEASVNNAVTCCCAMLLLGFSTDLIAERMTHLRPVEMRLELKQGLNNCSVINNSYNADLNSLSISLDFLQQQNQHPKKTLIISDMLQSGQEAGKLYGKISEALNGRGIQRLIGIGPDISSHESSFTGIEQKYFYTTTEAFIKDIPSFHFSDETILLKGARLFRFETISNALEQKVHETFLEINLDALRHNIRAYRRIMRPGVKMMAMVKAFSYGSGSFEIANLLRHSGIDYLAVAYADEGSDLRKFGVNLPIMVMNTETSGFENIIKHQLEPEIYSFNILHAFRQFLQHRNTAQYPVHIKIDTGMHRLGFEEEDTEELIKALKEDSSFKIISVFSHLAGSDEAVHDEFTKKQATEFNDIADRIEKATGQKFLRHISNSSAVFRHPDLQMDMVRLGIGLYGADASPEMQQRLQHVTTLKTTISQVRKINKGESVGYSRKGMVDKDSVIATVRIGYADGYPRMLGNGSGKMMVNGNAAPVIGNVCMDMTMLDITGIDAAEGDEVIVFGEAPSVTDVAGWAGTISYEILTNISQRVKRVYFEE